MERRALENRRREGATLQELLDAVAGASQHPWLRTGARCAFAVVFANRPAIARFAHDGRKVGPGGVAFEEAQSGREEKEPPCAAPRMPSGHALLAAPPFPAPRAESAAMGPPSGQTPTSDPPPAIPDRPTSVPRGFAAALAGPPQDTAVRMPEATREALSQLGRPPHARTEARQPPRPVRVDRSQQLTSLVAALAGRPFATSDDRTETALDRQCRAQIDFDQRRLELLAALRALER